MIVPVHCLSDGSHTDIDGYQIVLAHGTNELIVAGLSIQVQEWTGISMPTALEITREGTTGTDTEVTVGASRA